MQSEVYDPVVLDHWSYPAGTLPAWARGTVAGAFVLSLFIAVLGPHLLNFYDDQPRGWVANIAATVLAVGTVLALALPGAMRRQLRLAIALPALQLAALVMFAIAWFTSGNVALIEKYYAPMLATVPIHRVLPGVLVLSLVVGWACARGRRPLASETAHAMVMFSLAALLLVGLWVPIVSRIWPWLFHMPDKLGRPAALLAISLIPPLATAGGFTMLAFREPQLFARIRTATTYGAVVLGVVALLLSVNRSVAAATIYANFVHILLAFVGVAILAQLVLAAMVTLDTVRARRAFARSPVTGTIAVDSEPDSLVAGVEVTSWLRGPRAFVRGFTLVTPRGEVPIPGARLAGSLAPATTQLRVGMALTVLRTGDRVVVAGLTETSATADGTPFRTSDVPLADGDLVVAAAGPETPSASIGLALWRPSVAYLLIIVAVGLPTLVGALFSL